MKKNFASGLITGFCAALLVCVIVGSIFMLVQPKAEGSENDSSKASTQSEVPYDEIVTKLNKLQKLVDDNYLKDVSKTDFADGIYKGFIASLDDPYSVYYTPEEYKALMESSSGTYCGIGAIVSQNAKTGVITIVKPFANGPAYKQGILPGDILYKVNDKDVTGVDLTKVVSDMKGKPGTDVKITIVREGKADPISYTIARAQIDVPTVESKMLDNKIGYIAITEFDQITVSQFTAAVDQLEKDGMKGLIVDVRNNPGGLLTSVVKILDRLLPPELLVYTEDKYGNREDENAIDNKKVSVPMAVLINGQSASASEIFAGTLKDYKAATIIGTTSFGKGIVQKVIYIKDDGSAVKLTVSKYYTPNGHNIHGIGITPDIKVDLSEKVKNEVVIPATKDNQLQTAIKTIESKMK